MMTVLPVGILACLLVPAGTAPTATPAQPPTPPPTGVITDVVVERLDSTHAVIAWASGSTLLSSWLEYGETSDLGAQTREWSTRRAVLHRALATGLKPGTNYHYRACGNEQDGTQHCSPVAQFGTLSQHKPWPWTAAVPPWDPWAEPGLTTHRVDNRGACSTTGDGRPPANPLCRIPTSLPAGSVVDVYGDHDFSGGGYKVVANGTAAQPVFIRAKDGAMLRNINPHFLVRGSFVYVDHFVVEQGGFRIGYDLRDAQQPVSAEGVVFRWVEIRDSWWNGIDTWGRDGGILFSYVHHNQRQKKPDPFNSDQQGIMVVRGVGFWAVGNVSAYNAGDGFHANGRRNQPPGAVPPSKVYVADNVFDGNRENGTDLKQVVQIVLGQNVYNEHRGQPSDVPGYVFKYRDGSAEFVVSPTNISDGSGGTVGSEGPAEDVLYIANLFRNSGNGIRIEECQGKVSIVGNVFHDLNWGNVSTQQPTCAVDVVSNTILGGQNGIRGPAVSVVWRVLNNVVVNVESTDRSRGYFVIVDKAATGSEMSDNLFWAKGGQVKSRWSGPGSGNITAAPLFVDEANRNLRLQTGSPAKDKGFDLMAFHTALARQLGYSVQLDHDGLPVPVGLWDIGAYEVRP